MQPTDCQYCKGRGYDVITWVAVEDGTRGKDLHLCGCEAGLQLRRLKRKGKLGRDYLQYLSKEMPAN